MNRSLHLTLMLFSPIMVHLPTAQAENAPGLVQDTFLNREGVLSYHGRGLTLRTQDDSGWASLQINGAEFLYASGSIGGFLFRDQNPLAKTPPLFPDRSNITHNHLVGHIGSVSNGTHLIRFTADPKQDDYELYFGANSADETLRCSMFLSEGVKEIQVDGNRTVTREQGEAVTTRRAVLVHRDGEKLLIESTVPRGGESLPPSFTAGIVTHPSGKMLLALTFDTPGFKANPFRMSFGADPRPPSRLGLTHFDVFSSDDPEGYNRASGDVATFGVVNPEYGPGTELQYGFVFEWKGPEPFNGHAELEVVHAYGQLHYFERLELRDKASGIVTGDFHPEFNKPGVSEVWLRIVDEEGVLLWNDRYRMMYDRDHFKPILLVPDDFKTFWKDTLDTLAKIPLDAKTERVEKFKDVPDFEIYAVSFNGWEGKRFHAMMYVPREGRRPLPAILSAHPNTRGFNINRGKDGVFGSDIRQDKRFVTIVPLVRGHEIDTQDAPFNPPWWGPLENRETYTARAWYTTMVRAVDYLATRHDLVDMNRVVASGGSQGGTLAIIATALDPRISYCFADCPSNAQPHESMRHYASFGPSYGVIPEGSTKKDAESVLSYYNPVNFAPMIRVPTHVGIHIGDITVHSMGPLAIYQNLTALDATQKAFHPGFSHFHGSGPGLSKARNHVFLELTR